MPIIVRQDSTTLEQWDTDARIYTRTENGAVVVSRPFDDAENQQADAESAQAAATIVNDTRSINRAAILAQARIAYANNATYLALIVAGTATNADHIAQVPKLTRQMQAVIRLLVASDLLDS
jgi:hypothetical protein